MLKTAAAALLLLSLATGMAEAGVRSYFTPEVDGKRIDLCLSGQSDCGKPAADAFCKVNGYDEALLFQREATPETISCAGPSCTSFRQIKCYSTKDDFAGVALQ